MGRSFSQQVTDFVRETEQRMVAVRRESIQRTVAVMQEPVHTGGNMPVDTGFLRSSLTLTIGKSNLSTVENPNPEGAYSYDAGATSLIIMGSNLNDTVEAIYTAVYARVANYGGNNRAPRLFVDLAVQRWPQIVDQASKDLETRIKAKA